MNGHLFRVVPVIGALLALSIGVAACGSSNKPSSGTSSTSSTSSTSTTPSSSGKKITVGMVTDTGGLNDRSFNQSAYEALKKAEAQDGIKIRALTSTSNADYIPNLTTLARQKYDLVIAVGFLMADATEKVAKSFPNTHFAIIDSPQALMKTKPKNVEGLLFKEQEAGYIVGYMAGLYVKDKGGKQIISSVGGQKIPPVDHYIAGYMAGAKAANPKIQVLNGYSQVFDDQAKCKELALNQIAAGSQVVFQVAGQCGLGALDAAKGKGVQGIGVDKDQSFLGPHIFTSALKKVDEAVFATIQDGVNGTFKTGTDTVFDVKSKGVGFGNTNAVGSKYKPQGDQIEQKIASGAISNIPDTVPGK
jgi:basic membrane protein A and related proteins